MRIHIIHTYVFNLISVNVDYLRLQFNVAIYLLSLRSLSFRGRPNELINIARILSGSINHLGYFWLPPKRPQGLLVDLSSWA